jgi:hypothetical protein
MAACNAERKMRASIQSGSGSGDFNPITDPADLSLEVRLYAGVGFGGPLLASGLFTGLVAGFDNYADVSFSDTPLSVGHVYSAQLIDLSPRWGVAQGSPTYPGSAAIYIGDADPTFNWAFRVIPSAPVPEPRCSCCSAPGCSALL